jgi:DNA-directed RNA polymerase subunit RPC12/RpoP
MKKSAVNLLKKLKKCILIWTSIIFAIGVVFEFNCSAFNLPSCGRNLWVYNALWWVGSMYIIHLISEIKCDYCGEKIGLQNKWFLSPPYKCKSCGKMNNLLIERVEIDGVESSR